MSEGYTAVSAQSQALLATSTLTGMPYSLVVLADGISVVRQLEVLLQHVSACLQLEQTTLALWHASCHQLVCLDSMLHRILDMPCVPLQVEASILCKHVFAASKRTSSL